MSNRYAGAGYTGNDSGHMREGDLSLISQLLGEENVLRNEPMASHTSFRVGGPADYLLRIGSRRHLIQVLGILRDAQEPWYLLGRGTNLLVGDGGYRGCMIMLTGPELTGVSFRPGQDGRVYVQAGAGETLSALALTARDHSLTGLEFAAGIPGSLGGAIVMNAGAYGGSMDQIVTAVCLLMPDDTVQRLPAQEMHFGYRHSLLKEQSAVVLGAELSLPAGDPVQIAETMKELGRQRSEKQPLEYPSAGSTFKRPEGMYAGKLIMDAGLRGYGVGGAAVSEKHCGFVINKGGASAADVRAVIEAVRQRVYETFGVVLEEEVISIGEF